MSHQYKKDQEVFVKTGQTKVKAKFYSFTRERGYAFITNTRGENMKKVHLSKIEKVQV